MTKSAAVFSATLLSVLGSSAMFAQGQQTPQPMTFFVTSVGLGDGGNLGGVAGAD